MSDTTYNGWTNYETWNVNLWLDNTEGMYRDVVQLTRRALVANTPGEATDELAGALEEYVKSMWSHPDPEFADDPDAGGFGDLHARDGDSLDNVDWAEIASCWVETWQDEDD